MYTCPKCGHAFEPEPGCISEPLCPKCYPNLAVRANQQIVRLENNKVCTNKGIKERLSTIWIRWVLIIIGMLSLVGISIGSLHGIQYLKSTHNPYKPIIREYLIRRLHDPYSLRDVRISRPISMDLAHVVCVEFNAKNLMGAYIGIKMHKLVVIKDSIEEDTANQEDCFDSSKAKFAPWPEMENLSAQK